MPLDPKPVGSDSGISFSSASIAKVGVVTALQRLLNVATTGGSLALAARALSPSQFGVWIVCGNVLTLGAFADLGMGQALVAPLSRAFASGDVETANSCIRFSLGRLLRLIGIALALAAAIVLTATRIGYGSPGGTSLIALAAIAAPAASLAALGGLGTRILFASGATDFAPRIAAWVSVPQLVAMAAAVGLGTGVWGCTFAYLLVPNIVLAAGSWVAVCRAGVSPLPLQRARPSAIKSKVAGSTFFVIQLAEALSYESDVLLIGIVLGAAYNGQYGLGFRLFGFLPNIVVAILLAQWPTLSLRRSRAESTRMTTSEHRRLFAAVFVTAGLNFVLVLSKRRWAPFVGTTAQAIGFLLAFSHVFFWTINIVRVALVVRLYAADRQSSVLRIALITTPLNVVLSFALLKSVGVAGPLIASTAVQLLIVVPCYLRLLGTSGARNTAVHRLALPPAVNGTSFPSDSE